jgi:NADH-quinone oxidoreductase subunit J
MLRSIPNPEVIYAIFVVVLGASGLFLLLPQRHGLATPKRVHVVGGALTAVALLLFARYWTSPHGFPTGLFFYAFSFAALAGAVLTVTSRDPIHNALWFAAVILSTSGLFLLAGASFLAAGTIIVYAGAIIVMFLFVIMLAQMEGRALYDRAARAPGRATFTCFLLFWGVLYVLLSARTIPATRPGSTDPGAAERRLVRTDQLAELNNVGPDRPVREVLKHAARDTNRMSVLVVEQEGATPAEGGPAAEDTRTKTRQVARIRPKAHVAGLGESLFTDNLIVVELAGTLLFAALLGALSIATPKPPIRPGAHPPTPPPHL